MAEQENIKVVQDIMEMVTRHELHRTPEFFHEDYTADVPGVTGLTRDQARQWTQTLVDAFPDFNYEITRIVAHGDDVVVMSTISGTNTGPLPLPTGEIAPPTGRPFRTAVCYFYTVRDGKVAQAQGYMDMADILSQLGLFAIAERAREVGR